LETQKSAQIVEILKPDFAGTDIEIGKEV